MTSGVRRTSAVAAVSAIGIETRVAKTQIRTMSGITVDTINPAVKDMQYAVRGAIVSKAGEIAAALKEDPSKYPFDKIVMCNIGNPQSLGQKPITFFRQVLALCDFPDMLDSKEAETLFPADVRKRARDILALLGRDARDGRARQGFHRLDDALARAHAPVVPVVRVHLVLRRVPSVMMPVASLLGLLARGPGVLVREPLRPAALSVLAAGLGVVAGRGRGRGR